jgi:hypothetical protein
LMRRMRSSGVSFATSFRNEVMVDPDRWAGRLMLGVGSRARTTR